jgi:hypothetical protein
MNYKKSRDIKLGTCIINSLYQLKVKYYVLSYLLLNVMFKLDSKTAHLCLYEVFLFFV